LEHLSWGRAAAVLGLAHQQPLHLVLLWTWEWWAGVPRGSPPYPSHLVLQVSPSCICVYKKKKNVLRVTSEKYGKSRKIRLTPSPDLQPMAAADSYPSFLSFGYSLNPSCVIIEKAMMTAIQSLLCGAFCCFARCVLCIRHVEQIKL